jgi:Ras family protein
MLENEFTSLVSLPPCQQDEYSRLSRNASVGVHGYALVFSITSRETFERIEPINEALLNALGDAQDVPRVLVGSMKDLAHQRQVSMQVRRNIFCCMYPP